MKVRMLTTTLLATSLVWSSLFTMAHARSGCRMPLAGRLQGQVYDPVGAPIEGAQMKVSSPGKAVRVVVTDKEGRYLLPDLPEGPVTVEIHAPGFLQLRRTTRVDALEDQVMDFCLELGLTTDPPECWIKGRVFDISRHAISRARVIVMDAFNQNVVARTGTDEAGKFDLRVNRVGQYVVVAYKAAFVTDSKGLVVTGNRSVEFVLEPLQLK